MFAPKEAKIWLEEELPQKEERLRLVNLRPVAVHLHEEERLHQSAEQLHAVERLHQSADELLAVESLQAADASLQAADADLHAVQLHPAEEFLDARLSLDAEHLQERLVEKAS